MCLSCVGLISTGVSSSHFLATNLHIRFPLLCGAQNWDLEEFVKNEGWSLPVGQFQWKRGETSYVLLPGTVHLSRHPSSWPIRGHRSSDAFSPGPLLHWFNYTAATDLLSWGKIYCLRQNSRPISQGVDHCRGGIRKRTFQLPTGKENNRNSESAILPSKNLGDCLKSAKLTNVFTWKCEAN